MMTLHFHGTPITPTNVMLTLAGRCFCVSHARPDQVRLCHEIGQSVLLDNGAFSKWRKGRETDWPDYYAWADRWLDYPTTWAVIPDVIGAGSQEQDALIREWPHGKKGAPVYHLDPDLSQPVSRLLRLLDEWPRVCVGWADQSPILGDSYNRATDIMWNAVARVHQRTPWLHKLRGLQVIAEGPWPYASADSADIGKNHNRPQNTARGMADRWDAAQSPARWTITEPHPDLFEVAA